MLQDLELKKIEVSSAIVTSNQYEVLIIAVYRPPDCSFSDTNHDLEKIFSKIGNQSTIITSDLNIDYSKQNCLKEMYNQKLLENNLIQFINNYTRITAKSKTTIDHIISNIN